MLEHYNSLDVNEESFFNKWRRIMAGLKAPKGSGEYKSALFEIQRSFTSSAASTVTCILVLLLTIFFIGHTVDLPPPELEVTIVQPEVEEMEEIIEDDIPEPEPVDEIVTMDPGHTEQDADVETIVFDAPSFGDDSTVELVPMAIDIISSPMVISGLYGGRTGGGKATAVGKRGGGGSLTAVLKALRWLKDHQLENGSWEGADSPTAMCGLALLCYMAHGETPSSPEFGRTVENAIRYLLYAQNEDGTFKDAGNHYSYGHAIATYALCESYGMTKITMIKQPCQKAVKVVIDGQQMNGAWDYDYKQGARRDLSVTAWQVQALKAAKLSGIYVEGLDEALEKCIGGIKGFSAGGGKLSYNAMGEGDRYQLTAAGVLCLQLLGHSNDGATRSGLQYIQQFPMTWENPTPENQTYIWYYATQANFQNGGNEWKRWNDKMLPLLIKNQEEDGHWNHGSTISSCDVYDTTLACLCLEVYYRYLPTYEKVEAVKEGLESKDKEDIAVQVAL